MKTSHTTQMEVSRASIESLGENQRPEKLQGHWVIARAGKRVLRPGGMELTLSMLGALRIGRQDRVVELAAGLGATAQRVLQSNPREFWAVEREPAAARLLEERFAGTKARVVQADSAQTGLPAHSATVVYSEALLTMQSQIQKERIVSEAVRLLTEDGRYGIHELCLRPDDISDQKRREIQAALSSETHNGFQPLTQAEWHALLKQHDLRVTWSAVAPMQLLEPRRVLQDEGFIRAIGIAFRLATNGIIRERIRAMRRLFNTYSDHIGAYSIIGEL